MNQQLLAFLFAAVLLLGISSLWLVAPIWRQARSRESRNIVNRALGLAIATFVPVASIGLYLFFGNTQVVQEPWRALPGNKETLVSSVAMAKQKLAENPHNSQLLLAVARGEMLLQNHDQAILLLRRAQALLGQVPQVVLPLANALTMQNNGLVPDPAVRLLEDLHQEQPHNQDALWVLALAAEQRGRQELALDYWNLLLPLAQEADAQLAAQITDHIARLKNPFGITISIELEANNNPPPAAVLFVSAHKLNSNSAVPMPVAARRIEKPGFPLALTLEDKDSLNGNDLLSSANKLEIRAQLSTTGLINRQEQDADSPTATARWERQQQGRVRLVLTN